MNAPLNPVSQEDLTLLRELDNARVNLSLRIADLNVEHFQVLGALKRVRGELDALFRRIATERGLPEHSFVEVNPKTGEVVATLPEKSVEEVPAAVPAAVPGA